MYTEEQRGLEIDSEKIETNRYSIKENKRIRPTSIDYQSIVPILKTD